MPFPPPSPPLLPRKRDQLPDPHPQRKGLLRPATSLPAALRVLVQGGRGGGLVVVVPIAFNRVGVGRRRNNVRRRRVVAAAALDGV